MIRGGIKKFAEGVKQFTEVSNNLRRYQMILGGGQIIHGGIK